MSGHYCPECGGETGWREGDGWVLCHVCRGTGFVSDETRRALLPTPAEAVGAWRRAADRLRRDNPEWGEDRVLHVAARIAA